MHISWHFDEIKRVTFYYVPVAPALEPKVIVMSASRKRKRKVKNEKTKTKGTGHHPLDAPGNARGPRQIPFLETQSSCTPAPNRKERRPDRDCKS